MARVTFLGACGTVTGSSTLVEWSGARILVDCGMYQGTDEIEARNWNPFPFRPAEIDAVVLTHAHLDHTGLLPRLVAAGYQGPVYCTRATRPLSRLVLEDAGELQEEEARYARKKGYSRHAEPQPLFTEKDAKEALKLLEPVPFHAEREIAPGVRLRFCRAGHLLGAASVELTGKGADGERRTWCFSGDIGRYDVPILFDPEPPERPPAALVLESTYGDRLHEAANPTEALRAIVKETFDRGGFVLIPAFALGRTQDLLYHLSQLVDRGELSENDVFLDSPMAIRATEIYRQSAPEFDEEMRELVANGDNPLAADRFNRCRTVEESKRLNDRSEPAVIVASSGMATGGRIVHHLARRLPDPETSVVFVGYQAAGTRGRALIDGADRVSIHGRHIPVGARIHQIHGLSAHGDRADLVRWCRALAAPPGRIFLNHGEDSARKALAAELATLGLPRPALPFAGESHPLVSHPRLASAARSVRRIVRRMGEDEVMLRASALAFSTLLSLVPLLSVMTIFVARALREDDGRIVDLVADLLPYREEAVVEALRSFTEQAGSISGVSVISFLVVTILTFLGAQDSLFKIFRVDRSPSLLRRLITFSLLFLWGPMVVGVAQTGLVLFAQWSPSFAVALRESALLRLVPALLTFPALMLFYWRAALGRVRLRHAAVGALAATLALEALKALFAFYVSELTEVQRAVYGSFAIALFFVASVQFAWVILLLGAELAALAATKEEEEAGERSARTGADDAWRSLVLLAAIGDRDEPAERKTPTALAARAGIDAPEVDRLLAPLVERGFLIAARSLEDAYRLAVPPGELRLRRVFDVHTLAVRPSEAEAELAPLAARLLGAARAELADMTLGDLLEPKRGGELPALGDDTLSTLIRARPVARKDAAPPDPFEEPRGGRANEEPLPTAAAAEGRGDASDRDGGSA